MKCACYMPLCPFNCPFKNLGSMYLNFIQISHIHLIGHYLYPTSSIMQETHRTNENDKLSHLYFLETYLEHIKIGLKISFICCRNFAMHRIFLLASEAPYKSIICAYGMVDSNYIKSLCRRACRIGGYIVFKLWNASYNYCLHYHALRQHRHILDRLHFPNSHNPKQ
jgi:hypothetical protein